MHRLRQSIDGRELANRGKMLAPLPPRAACHGLHPLERAGVTVPRRDAAARSGAADAAAASATARASAAAAPSRPARAATARRSISRDLAGIVDYTPAECVFTALAGTPLRRDRRGAGRARSVPAVRSAARPGRRHHRRHRGGRASGPGPLSLRRRARLRDRRRGRRRRRPPGPRRGGTGREERRRVPAPPCAGRQRRPLRRRRRGHLQGVPAARGAAHAAGRRAALADAIDALIDVRAIGPTSSARRRSRRPHGDGRARRRGRRRCRRGRSASGTRSWGVDRDGPRGAADVARLGGRGGVAPGRPPARRRSSRCRCTPALQPVALALALGRRATGGGAAVLLATAGPWRGGWPALADARRPASCRAARMRLSARDPRCSASARQRVPRAGAADARPGGTIL